MPRFPATIFALCAVGAGIVLVALWSGERTSAARQPRRDAHAAVAFGAGIDLARRLAVAARDADAGTPDASAPGIEACLRVIDANGAPIGGAHVVVRLRDPSLTLGEGTSRDDGLAAIGLPGVAVGNVTATATTDDGREGALGWLYGTSCDLALEALPAVTVVAVSTLRGVVVDESGAPVAAARLALLDVAGLAGAERVGDVLIAPPDDAFLREMLAADPTDAADLSKTASDGSFVLPLHGAGAWAVTARAGGTSTSFAGPVQLLPGRTASVRIVLHPGGAALGTVVDDDGAPVRAATVMLSAGDTAASTSTGDDGRFRVDGLPRAAWRAIVVAGAYVASGSQPLELDHPETRLAISRGATLLVSVRLPAVHPSYLTGFAIGPEVRSFGLSDGADGPSRGRLDSVRPGTYRIWLAGAGLFANLGDVVVPARGETSVDAIVSDGRRLRTRVPEGVHPTAGNAMVTVGDQSFPVGTDGTSDVVLSGSLRGVHVTLGAWDPSARRSLTAERDLDDGAGDVVVPLVAGPVQRDDADEEDDYVATCAVPLSAVSFDGVATIAEATAVATPPLEQGDLIVSIEGARPVDGDVYSTDGWTGACDARVELLIERPSTGQRFEATIVRDYVPDDD